MTRRAPVKVLIVDDSAVVRAALTRVLAEEPDIEVVGGARDPFDARELIMATRPDVIILDIEMPRMDGLTFLKKLREHYPVPVIMCSGVAPSNSAAALRAIELGAIDIVAKPDRGGPARLRRLGEELADKIRAASISTSRPPPVPTSAKPAAARSFRAAGLDPERFLIAIGASTGGTESINLLLSHVPPDFPPVAIVQHMPEGFTRSFAERLNRNCALSVSEAVDGDKLHSGKAVVARGGSQMGVGGRNGHWHINFGSDELFNRHCPSVDVLYDSIVGSSAKTTVGILLTGMGNDGARGLCDLRKAGAITVAQNQESCVVFGMPKVAIEMGGAEHIASPANIPNIVLDALAKRQKKSKSVAASPSP